MEKHPSILKSESNSSKANPTRSRFGVRLIESQSDSEETIDIPENIKSIISNFRKSGSCGASKSPIQSPMMKPSDYKWFEGLFDEFSIDFLNDKNIPNITMEEAQKVGVNVSMKEYNHKVLF